MRLQEVSVQVKIAKDRELAYFMENFMHKVKN